MADHRRLVKLVRLVVVVVVVTLRRPVMLSRSMVTVRLLLCTKWLLPVVSTTVLLVVMRPLPMVPLRRGPSVVVRRSVGRRIYVQQERRRQRQKSWQWLRSHRGARRGPRPATPG